MYVKNSLILHVIDEATRYQTARWLKNVIVKHTWDMLRLCWIDVYLESSEYIQHDADKNFVSRKFRQHAIIMTIIIKFVLVEAHWSIEIVKRYHAVLRRAYEVIITEELDLNKTSGLQMTIKAINDTADSDELVLTLLIYDVYSRMTRNDAFISIIALRAAVLEKVMTAVRKIRNEKMINDALNTRNGPMMQSVHDLSLMSFILVWRESTDERRGQWTESFRLLGINNETCQIELPSGSTEFRTTQVKPYYEENGPIEEEILRAQGPEIEFENPAPSQSGRFLEVHISIRQNQVSIITFVQDSTSSTISSSIIIFIQDSASPISNSITSFREFMKKEINDLLDRDVFEIISLIDVPHEIRIFNSRFVNKIKHFGTSEAYEKFRLIVQTYNDHDKKMILTQSSTIQRMSQRLILALAVTLLHLKLYLRDVTQIYVQSITKLNREFYARSSSDLELELDDRAILHIIKSLYDILEAENHWFKTYHSHHISKLQMIEFTYDFCLLFINEDRDFKLIKLQTDDTLILTDEIFAATKKNELVNAKIMIKSRETLIIFISIKFNNDYIKLLINEIIHLTQKNQMRNIHLMITKQAILMRSKNKSRANVFSKDQYVTQRARDAYIVTICQLEAAFDFSFAAQTINSDEKNIQTLNKRLIWQMKNFNRDLKFVSLDQKTLRLIIFCDVSFANNRDHSSQIEYVICLVDEDDIIIITCRVNIVHWSFIKCKRIIRSVLASELYVMTHDFDSGSVLRVIIDEILKKSSLSLIVCTDSKSLYDYLVKLGSMQKKRLMIDVMTLRQTYERREIVEVRWIHGENNSVDSMTKARSSRALEKLININTNNLSEAVWVERGNETI